MQIVFITIFIIIIIIIVITTVGVQNAIDPYISLPPELSQFFERLLQ